MPLLNRSAWNGCLLGLWLCSLAAPALAVAQTQNEEETLETYSEEEPLVAPTPAPAPVVDDEGYGDPREPSIQSRAGDDDPDLGFAVELVAGTMLLDSARGALVDIRFAYGARATLPFGRLFWDEYVREALFADVSWLYSAARTGTATLFTDTNYHAFTAAPGWAFFLGRGSPWSLYLQLGAGLSYTFASLHTPGLESQVAGTKLLVQYGGGVRFRPALSRDRSVHLSVRVELTRFRRGYMDDTLLGGSLGLTF